MHSKDTDKLKKRWWKLRLTAYHDFYLRQVLTPILESAFNLKITCLTFVCKHRATNLIGRLRQRQCFANWPKESQSPYRHLWGNDGGVPREAWFAWILHWISGRWNILSLGLFASRISHSKLECAAFFFSEGKTAKIPRNRECKGTDSKISNRPWK